MATFPKGIEVKRVDYARSETLVQALEGHDALVITLSGRSPFQEIEAKLIRAAGEAGVSWILPNEWSPDSTHQGVIKDVFLFGMKAATRSLIEEIGKTSYIGLSTGFWYEYSLAIPKNFGFDFKERKVQFYDDGNTKISVSTWPQVCSSTLFQPKHIDLISRSAVPSLHCLVSPSNLSNRPRKLFWRNSRTEWCTPTPSPLISETCLHLLVV